MIRLDLQNSIRNNLLVGSADENLVHTTREALNNFVRGKLKEYRTEDEIFILENIPSDCLNLVQYVNLYDYVDPSIVTEEVRKKWRTGDVSIYFSDDLRPVLSINTMGRFSDEDKVKMSKLLYNYKEAEYNYVAMEDRIKAVFGSPFINSEIVNKAIPGLLDKIINKNGSAI